MNEEVIVFAWIITVVLYVIILWKFTLLGKYTNDLDNRINLLKVIDSADEYCCKCFIQGITYETRCKNANKFKE